MLQTSRRSAPGFPARVEPRTEFERLLAPVLQPAYGTALRLTRDRSTAEDLVQDAALLAFRAFDSFEPRSNFKAWFLRILTNAFYSKYRREKHERGNVSIDEPPPLYLYRQTQELGWHSNLPDPAAALMDRLDGEHVAAALDGLPTEYRVVATLYFIDDLPYDQIAQVVGCPIGTVRSRLHRARRSLQQALWQVAVERGIVNVVAERSAGGTDDRHTPQG